MGSYLQLRRAEGLEAFALDADAVTVGKAAGNSVVISADRTVSRLHAVLERFPAGWCIRDLASRNGTFINGERIVGERPLHAGDEIRLGKTTLIYRLDQAPEPDTATEVGKPPPELTPREREVLAALCQPVVEGDVFTEPASVHEVAEALFVSEAAVKQHLIRLYDKFELPEGTRRRARLANEAVRRGAIQLADFGGGTHRSDDR
jgi:pSer/pThr/pTyr-binding forkhead associated (FHA) protein